MFQPLKKNKPKIRLEYTRSSVIFLRYYPIVKAKKIVKKYVLTKNYYENPLRYGNIVRDIRFCPQKIRKYDIIDKDFNAHYHIK